MRNCRKKLSVCVKSTLRPMARMYFGKKKYKKQTRGNVFIHNVFLLLLMILGYLIHPENARLRLTTFSHLRFSFL